MYSRQNMLMQVNNAEENRLSYIIELGYRNEKRWVGGNGSLGHIGYIELWYIYSSTTEPTGLTEHTRFQLQQPNLNMCLSGRQAEA